MTEPLDDARATTAEIQSGMDRQQWAENLIQQLPMQHDGRNSWLLNYGRREEAQAMRHARGLTFNEQSQAINPPALRPAPVPQCEAEPVAWQARYKGKAVGGPNEWFQVDHPKEHNNPENFEYRPLYATPPSRSDAERQRLDYDAQTSRRLESAKAHQRSNAESAEAIVNQARKVYEDHRGDDAWFAMERAYVRLISELLVPPPSEAGREEIQLQARPAEGGEWINIYPAQLQWMAKEGHDVRALSPDPGTVAVASAQRNTDATPANRSTAKATAIVGDDRESMETQPTKVASPEAGSPSISSTDRNTS